MKKLLTAYATLVLGIMLPTALWAQAYQAEKNNPYIKVKPTADVQAFAFNLADVRLLDGSPFKQAMDKDAEYLLSLDVDRLLHRFHAHAGLAPKGEVYGGWESQGLSGHTLGHYLSAAAMMYAATGDGRFKEKTDYAIAELERCQVARKTGYVGAIPNEDSIFWKVQHGIIKTSGFDLNGGWSPWYTVHKVMAGLTDAYLFTGNAKALKIVIGMADWTETILKDLNDEQLENMRKCEYGGMNDILVHIYELTGNQKYLDLSFKFHDHFVMDELAKRIDPLPGKHSNTNVPKAIGAARRFTLTGSETDKTISSFFWETMTQNHTYVIGGNSNYEYCGDPNKLNDRLSDNTCETCNTYNMLKLTRQLFAIQPSSTYTDYYERALYNHILASQNPTNGMMCYFVPLRMGTRKRFSDPFNTFTCCVGSGIENHSKYTEGIYSEGKDGSLWVHLFIPSQLTWNEKKTVVRMETAFPGGEKVRLTINSEKPQRWALKIRQPKWVKGSISVNVNQKPAKATADASGYLVIDRIWGKNEVVELTLPMQLYTEAMPDNPNRIAMLYGPVVLAGALGKEMPDPNFGTTVLLTDNRDVTAWAQADVSRPLTFVNTVAKPYPVTLLPFYSIYDQYYNVYWDYFTTSDWNQRQAEYEAEKKRLADIEARTIDNMRIGEMQPERDHNLTASEKSYVSDALGRMGREARTGGFFEWDMKVDASIKSSLMCSYIGDDKNRGFDLLIDGVKIGTQELNGGATGRFFDVSYPIPPELLKGKTKVRVRVQGHPNKTAGRVFGCRILRE